MTWSRSASRCKAGPWIARSRSLATSPSAAQPDLIDALEALSPSELNSIVMHLSRRLARERDLPDLAAQVSRTPLLNPATSDARMLLEIDRMAFASAAAFEAIELSPASPLGAAAAAGIDPNNALAATRQAEVASDPTMGQALECARRRKRDRSTTVRLATSQRVVRMQPTTVKVYTPHFRLFTLVSAGKDTGDECFERAELLIHLDAWLRLLRSLARGGFAIGRVRVELSDTRVVRALVEARGLDLAVISARVRSHQHGSEEQVLEEAGVSLPRAVIDPSAELADDPAVAPFVPRLMKIESEVCETLRARYPETELVFDFGRLQALTYYSGPTFRIVCGPEGERMPVGDGGFSDWTQRILSDRKERMLASAIGTEAISKRYAPPRAKHGELRAEMLTSGIWKLSSVLLSRRGSVWAIDPGYFPRELDAIADRSRAHGRVEHVVFTHGHWDHVIGWRTFPEAEVLGSASLSHAVRTKSERAAQDMASARDFDGRWYVERNGPLDWPEHIRTIEEGTKLDLGGASVEAIHLPGHSPDGLGLIVPELGLLIAGDYLSPEEIPFVDDLAAYRATLRRLIDLLGSLDEVIPGHGPRLDRNAALAIARADLEYLERLAFAESHEARLAIPLPRAAEVPGMIDHHRENVARASASVSNPGFENPTI